MAYKTQFLLQFNNKKSTHTFAGKKSAEENIDPEKDPPTLYTFCLQICHYIPSKAQRVLFPPVLFVRAKHIAYLRYTTATIL